MTAHWQLGEIEQKPEQAIEFLSARGMRPYKNIYESVAKLWGQYRWEYAVRLAESIGPYTLDDVLAREAKRAGLVLDKNGIVPFASVADYLQRNWLERALEKTYTVWEMRDFFVRENLNAQILYVAPKSIDVIKSLQRVETSNSNVWQELESIDALECHRNPALYFSTRRLS